MSAGMLVQQLIVGCLILGAAVSIVSPKGGKAIMVWPFKLLWGLFTGAASAVLKTANELLVKFLSWVGYGLLNFIRARFGLAPIKPQKKKKKKP